MDFGDDVMDGGGSDAQRRKKRYHRHTPRQIQQLEAMFKECPHPDENQRLQLSRELGLEPRQIKFWFQNRRTQMKAQHERQDNCFLRAENDKIRCENIAMREALRNVICPTCGGPPVSDDYFDEQKLRMENARLKDELDRVSSMTSKYLGRPITQLPPVQPLSMSSSLDLSVGGLGSPSLGPSLDLDLLSGGSSGYAPFHLPTMTVSEMERPMMAEMATRAMDELIRMAQAGEHLWVKTPGGGGPDAREVLNVDTYDSIFAKPGGSFRGPDVHVEGSRDSGLVFMNAIGLVDMFMDSQVDGVLPFHRVQGAHDRRPRERHGRAERVFGSDVRGTARDVTSRPDARLLLPPLLPADRARAVGDRRHLGGPAAARRQVRRAAVALVPPPVGLSHRRYGRRLLQGDLGGAHGDRGQGSDPPALPRPHPQRRRVRGAPVARRAAEGVRAVRVPHHGRHATPRHCSCRSDAGREAEHDEAVAADGEQLLREPERVAAPPVDDAVGSQRRGRPRHGAPEHGPGATQWRGAQRGHVHLAARPVRPGVRLRPRRAHALPVGRAVAR